MRQADWTEVNDPIGSVEVPASYYLAIFEFNNVLYYGRGISKKTASEHLFQRMVASPVMPSAPQKVDPTESLPNAVYTLTFNRETLLVTLDVSSTKVDGKPVSIEIPRGRHEALMSLTRHILRQ